MVEGKKKWAKHKGEAKKADKPKEAYSRVEDPHADDTKQARLTKQIKTMDHAYKTKAASNKSMRHSMYGKEKD